MKASEETMRTPQGTMQLVLIRHGESEWNRLNLFTGWTDVELSEAGRAEAVEGGRMLAQEGFDFDICFTSRLKRAIHTLDIVLTELDRSWLPVVKAWELNERHYGALQGLDKAETAAKNGDEQVRIWRRSFDVEPPALQPGDERDPRSQAMYRDVPACCLPLSECLATTVKRAWPYFEREILPRMRSGERVLVAAHGNSLRALVMKLEGLTPEEILEVNIPTGVPLVYKVDAGMHVIEKRYLGDPAAVSAKMEAVAAQGKARG